MVNERDSRNLRINASMWGARSASFKGIDVMRNAMRFPKREDGVFVNCGITDAHRIMLIGRGYRAVSEHNDARDLDAVQALLPTIFDEQTSNARKKRRLRLLLRLRGFSLAGLKATEVEAKIQAALDLAMRDWWLHAPDDEIERATYLYDHRGFD
jgi:hypothetical protein